MMEMIDEKNAEKGGRIVPDNFVPSIVEAIKEANQIYDSSPQGRVLRLQKEVYAIVNTTEKVSTKLDSNEKMNRILDDLKMILMDLIDKQVCIKHIPTDLEDVIFPKDELDSEVEVELKELGLESDSELKSELKSKSKSKSKSEGGEDSYIFHDENDKLDSRIESVERELNKYKTLEALPKEEEEEENIEDFDTEDMKILESELKSMAGDLSLK